MADDDNTTSVLTPVTILDRAVTLGANPDVIEKLMALQERWEAHQARKAFDAALADAHKDFPNIIKDTAVDQGKGRPNYKYEKLDKVCNTVDPILGNHSLAYRWRFSTGADRWVTCTCIVSHRQGHREESSLSAPPDTTGAKNAVQSSGSTVTYLKRYTLLGALGLVAGDDSDGRGGGNWVEPPITAEQVVEITALAKELSEDDMVRFTASVGAIEQIPAKDFTRTMNRLHATKHASEQKKEEPNGSK